MHSQTTANSSRSCSQCARSHRKCDGVSPALAALAIPCTRCRTLGHECDWVGRRDNRRRLSDRDARTLRQNIYGLEEKVKRLEEIIARHGLDGELDEVDEVGGSSEDVPDMNSVANSFGGLVLENGTVQYYGKTAPFLDHPPPPPAEFDIPGNWHKPYQLKLEPQEDNHFPENWNTFLPDRTILLSRHEHDRALLEFFVFFAGWQLRVIPHLFLRDMGVATSNPTNHIRTQHYSKVLHNAILSVAFAYSDDEGRRSRAYRDQFAKEAKSLLEVECQQASLATVMGLAILSSYHSGFSEQSLGFMYFGMAIRMGEAIGLHIPLGALRDDVVPDSNVIERNWIFWSLFCQDKCWSLYVGRSQGLGLPPRDFGEPEGSTELSEWMDKHVYMLDEFRTAGTPNLAPVDSTFRYQVSLMQVASGVLDIAYVPMRELDLSRVRQLHGKLRQWEQDLPDRLRCHPNQLGSKGTIYPPHLFSLHLCFHWLLILLLRPFFKDDKPKPNAPTSRIASGRDIVIRDLQTTALDECTFSARQIVKLFSRYRDIYGLRRITVTAVQVVYVAGLIHLAKAIAPSDLKSQHTDAVRSVRNCITILEEIGSTWTSGTVTARLLEGLFNKATNPKGKSKENSHTLSSMQTDANTEPPNGLRPELSEPGVHAEATRSVEVPISQFIGTDYSSYVKDGDNYPGPDFDMRCFDLLSVGNPLDTWASCGPTPAMGSNPTSLEAPWLPDSLDFSFGPWSISDPYFYQHDLTDQL